MYLNLDRSRANKISKVDWGDDSLGKNICFENMKTNLHEEEIKFLSTHVERWAWLHILVDPGGLLVS